MTMTDNELQSSDHDSHDDHDYSWENGHLILAALAPRSASRPARRGATPSVAPEDPSAASSDSPKKPGLLYRGARASGRGARAVARRINNRIPPHRRVHAAFIGVPAIVLGLIILLAALAAVRYLNRDVTPQAAAPQPQNSQAAAPSLPPLRKDGVLTGVHAKDRCPRDANYANANNAFDGDLNTAWICTRAKNEDGQVIQVDFGRQVTLTQIRCIGGFVAPDQWNRHQIVTEFEIWFPKELRRDPITINTDGAPDYRSVIGGVNPPATLSQILIRVKTTISPPNPPEQDSQATGDKITTVASSECQFIGTDGPAS